jgi:hypothetical protein
MAQIVKQEIIKTPAAINAQTKTIFESIVNLIKIKHLS